MLRVMTLAMARARFRVRVRFRSVGHIGVRDPALSFPNMKATVALISSSMSICHGGVKRACPYSYP